MPSAKFHHNKRQQLKLNWPLQFILIINFGLLSLADDPTSEPPFPVPLEYNGGRLHIVSEQFDQAGGYLTREEYVDLMIGKATFVQMSNTDRGTFHMDAASQSSYYYSPYECWAYSFPDKPVKMSKSGFWVHEYSNTAAGEYRRMYLTGVTAIWLNAKNLPKTYSRTSSAYSASKDVYQLAHLWVAKMGDTKASFYFHEVSKVHETKEIITLTLETIVLEIGLHKTSINVLAYEFELDESVYARELQLPLGYGCYSIGSAESMTELVKQVGNAGLSERFRLEAIATKLEGEQRSAEKVSLEFVRSSQMYDLNIGQRQLPEFHLLRQRSSKLDVKTVRDHVLNVVYQLDMINGTCAISSKAEALKADEARANVIFPNGLELKLNKDMLDVLFFKSEGYQFVKSGPEEGINYVYLTLPSSPHLFDRKGSARIVRKYSTRDESIVKLDSVTMWIMDQPARSRSDIKEIYQFTVLESTDFNSIAERARVMDMSEECYLNNEKEMKYGRDYAWMELHYPVTSDFQLKKLPDDMNAIKRSFYGNMNGAGVNYLRIPRLEMMIDEVGFTLRLLMVDAPMLHVIFDKTENSSFEPSESDKLEYFSEIAPDLRHCSEMCRLNQCLAFSFCANSFSCILAHPPQETQFESLKERTVNKSDCSSFKIPAGFDYDDYHRSRLHHFIATLQRHDLANLELPKAPSELSVPREESGISLAKELKLRVQYGRQIIEYLSEKDMGSVVVITGLLIAAPDRFEVEQDPLLEFDLEGKDELEAEDEYEAPAFHEGLNRNRFNYRALVDDQMDINDNKRDARRYTGIDYDQCALACVDGKCSSFSYCKQRQECIITNLWDLQVIRSNNFITTDIDCAIVQRDFLTKFHKLPEVKQPTLPALEVKRIATGINPSVCAHGCVIESGFNCLSFTFCRSGATAGAGNCFYSDSRSLQPDQVRDNLEQTTDCDHYSRSYLADFTRIEYRELLPKALIELKTSQVEGLSVDRCAEMCATQVLDCTAFQFCYEPDRQRAKQQCTLIESSPENRREDYRVLLDDDGKVAQAGRLFSGNQNCHVFSLKKGSNEAQLRQLALNPLRKNEQSYGDASSQSQSSGLTVIGGFMLFVCLTVVFSALGTAFVAAQKRSATLRSRMDHLRALMGRYY